MDSLAADFDVAGPAGPGRKEEEFHACSGASGPGYSAAWIMWLAARQLGWTSAGADRRKNG